MDPTKLLEADHRQVESLFDQIQKAQGPERQPLLTELERSLRAHFELEEHALYPAMEPVTGHDEVEEANTEHGLAKTALEQVMSLAPDKPGFAAALEACKAGIMHHVEDEEGKVFPQLRKDGSVLERIAGPFMEERRRLGLPVDAEALAKVSTKEELVEEARSAGISGASSMNKDELAGAVAASMANT